MATIYEQRARVFKAFCDEKRQRILELLQNGEQCTCVLTAKLDMPQSTLSYHMKILCESGNVNVLEDGKWTHYHINEAAAARAVEMLKEITKQNGKALDCCTCGK